MKEKGWKERLGKFPFIRMYLLKKFKANNPREQGMADILTLVKDKEFHDLIDFIQKELDKAREEGARDVFTRDEWFMLKLAMNDIFNGGNRAYEDISNKIKSQLSKLTTK